MAGYLDQFPAGVQVGEVFTNIHGQAARIAETLTELRTAATRRLHNDYESVPGVELAVLLTIGHGIVGMPSETTHIFAETKEPPTLHKLVAVTSMRRRTAARHDRDNVYPTRIVGSRGDEEPVGDYQIRQRGVQGDIEIHLGGPSLTRDSASPEPRGYASFIPPRKVEDLSDRDRERLDVVSHGIVRNLAAIRLILAGGSAKDALIVLGRQVEHAPAVAA